MSSKLKRRRELIAIAEGEGLKVLDASMTGGGHYSFTVEVNGRRRKLTAAASPRVEWSSTVKFRGDCRRFKIEAQGEKA
jgi:hypothetical protein